MMGKFNDWHLYIRGAKVLYMGRKWELHGIVRDWVYLYDNDNLEPIGDSVSKCQFILRSILSMTSKEHHEYFQTFGNWPTDFALLSDYQDQYLQQSVGEPKVWLWLLSKGFDLFDLIESGQAIDAATLK